MSNPRVLFIYWDVEVGKIWQEIEKTDETKLEVRIVVQGGGRGEFNVKDKLKRACTLLSIDTGKPGILTPEELRNYAKLQHIPDKNICVLYSGSRTTEIEEAKRSNKPITIFESDTGMLEKLNDFIPSKSIVKNYGTAEDGRGAAAGAGADTGAGVGMEKLARSGERGDAVAGKHTKPKEEATTHLQDDDLEDEPFDPVSQWKKNYFECNWLTQCCSSLFSCLTSSPKYVAVPCREEEQQQAHIRQRGLSRGGDQV